MYSWHNEEKRGRKESEMATKREKRCNVTKNMLPGYTLRTRLPSKGASEASGSSGIGLKSGFLEATALSPYKDFWAPLLFPFPFFFLRLFKAWENVLEHRHWERWSTMYPSEPQIKFLQKHLRLVIPFKTWETWVRVTGLGSLQRSTKIKSWTQFMNCRVTVCISQSMCWNKFWISEKQVRCCRTGQTEDKRNYN